MPKISWIAKVKEDAWEAYRMQKTKRQEMEAKN
jgi:hypothetical protein